MSTAYEKELAAGSLRYYAGLVEDAFNSLPALSAQAWDCPAADAFADGARAEDANLESAAGTMRSVATSLENAAAAQRAAEAAAATAAAEAAVVAAAAGTPDPPSPGVPSNVF